MQGVTSLAKPEKTKNPLTWEKSVKLPSFLAKTETPNRTNHRNRKTTDFKCKKLKNRTKNEPNQENGKSQHARPLIKLRSPHPCYRLKNLEDSSDDILTYFGHFDHHKGTRVVENGDMHCRRPTWLFKMRKPWRDKPLKKRWWWWWW